MNPKLNREYSDPGDVKLMKEMVKVPFDRMISQHTERSIDALKTYLIRHRPLRAELRGTFVAV